MDDLMPRWMPPLIILTIASAMAGCADDAAPDHRWQRTARGIIVSPAEGPAAQVRLEVVAADIIRVTAFPTTDLELPASLMVTADTSADFNVDTSGDTLVLKSAHTQVHVSLTNGLVRFEDPTGQPLLEESSRAPFTPVTTGGEQYYEIRQQWNRGSDEGFYGLGQHQNEQFNFNGEDVELAQHNIVIAMPYVVSSRHYGVLWDNNSLTRFGDARTYGPISDALIVRDTDGAHRGLRAEYFVDGKLVAERLEADPNFQFLKDQGNWPDGLSQNTPNLSVVWSGSIESRTLGAHKLRLYSSGYMKLFVDGELIVDRWRQNWNPWFHNFDIEMQPGERRDIRIEWQVDGGYMRLVHLDPLPAEDRHSLSLYSEFGQAVDYYFVAGGRLDDVVAGYRRLTGETQLLPRWAYGFWQSRERYQTQQQLLDVLREYRQRRIPIDNIVLDWFYWPEDSWGSHEFDTNRFPDARAMVDAVHELNAKIMISVWPKFYPTTDNYKELAALGAVYPHAIDTAQVDWVGPGYVSTFYDPYSPQARRVYWRQIREKLAVAGFDAWWMDATEPDLGSNADLDERKLRMTPTALGSGAAYFNSYGLMNAMAVFDGLQELAPEQRVMILTRSGFPGVQRYGAAVWSGDITSTWADFRAQVPAGLNMSLAGLANWTFDAGGFTPEQRFASDEISDADRAEWRELQTRWFQFAAFAPLFRAHGQYPYREIFNIAEEDSPEYESMAWHVRLRYRLLPYIYTLAANTGPRHGTIMRALIMDFPGDPAVRDLGDQYLFGPSLLVKPVTDYGARTVDVYLPDGSDWFDFHSGDQFAGGQQITADAPLTRMPLYVRAGSILPIGPDVQYSGENPDGDITLFVYTGADGSFELYEDDGESIAYRSGAFSRIPMSYDDASGTLTIGARAGQFDAMPPTRRISVRWISGPTESATDFTAPADAQVDYTGEAVTITGARRETRQSRTVANSN
jgi:alpha-D-xyloside xylohydrolase